MHAARRLANVDGYREEGAELLRRLANDTTLGGYQRVAAAGQLCYVEPVHNGHQEGAYRAGEKEAWEELGTALAGDGEEAEGVELLLRLSQDITFGERSAASRQLVSVLTRRALQNDKNRIPPSQRELTTVFTSAGPLRVPSPGLTPEQLQRLEEGLARRSAARSLPNKHGL